MMLYKPQKAQKKDQETTKILNLFKLLLLNNLSH
jgi:hypothetical protein